MKRFVLSLALAAAMVCSCANDSEPLYKDASAPIEKRLNDLLDRMTVDEMIAQTNLIPHWMSVDSSVRAAIARDKVGAVLKASGTELTRSLQEEALKSSRLGIPLMFHEDVIHGFRTIFPIPLAEACCFDRGAVERNSVAIAREAASAGLQLTYAPMVDISVDGRWGRVMETSGEDPYLCAELAAARVRGFQGKDLSHPATIMACAKHFAGYAAVQAGRDYNNTEFSHRELEEIYLPPYRACIEAGVGSVMESYLTYDGLPVTFSRYLLSDVLRDELGFEGLLMTDWKTMWYAYKEGAVEDQKTSAYRAISAGIDMDMSSEHFVRHLRSLYDEGKVSKKQLRTAAYNCLKPKFEMGLFDDPFRYCDPQRETEELLSSEIRRTAREAACGSMVLLQNNGGLLPLSKGSDVLVDGPFAAQGGDYLGAWSCKGRAEEVVTVSEALEEIFRIKAGAPVAIVCIGEPKGIIGEGVSTGKLEIEQKQIEILIKYRKMGKKVVAVLFNGRPLCLSEVLENSDAVLEAWYPGTEGGHAVADILCGDYNPIGRLCQTFPRHVGQVPIRYNNYRTFCEIYACDIESGPQFPFGFGLSYTEFEYGEPQLEAERFSIGEPVRVKVEITNTGTRTGTETVQLYVCDLFASVVPRDRQLKEFTKVTLAPGEKTTVEFTLDSSAFEIYSQRHIWEVEPGEFRIEVGRNSLDTKSVNLYME